MLQQACALSQPREATLLEVPAAEIVARSCAGPGSVMLSRSLNTTNFAQPSKQLRGDAGFEEPQAPANILQGHAAMASAEPTLLAAAAGGESKTGPDSDSLATSQAPRPACRNLLRRTWPMRLGHPFLPQAGTWQ